MPKEKKAKESETVKKPSEATVEVAAKPETPAPKKAPAKRTVPSKKADEKAVVETIILQSAGVEWNVADLRARVVDAYVSEGHRQSSIKTLELYVKPEERKVYYVINGKTTGSVSVD